MQELAFSVTLHGPPVLEFCQRLTLGLMLLQIHATIPTGSKSLLEVREQLDVFMANQQKLGVRPEGVSIQL
jgi:hypothetical protein